MSKGNDGVWLQASFQEKVRAFCANQPADWHRFTDSKAAGRFVQQQPGDFLFLVPNAAILVEVKSTEVSAPLKSLLDAGQCGKHRLWHRAGHPSVFVYGDRKAELLQCFSGMRVLETPRLSSLAPIWTGKLFQMAGLIKELYDEYTTSI